MPDSSLPPTTSHYVVLYRYPAGPLTTPYHRSPKRTSSSANSPSSSSPPPPLPLAGPVILKQECTILNIGDSDGLPRLYYIPKSTLVLRRVDLFRPTLQGVEVTYAGGRAEFQKLLNRGARH
ncbi:hypothetical protein B0J15DRAFT_472392 [Fusarium solani]|uniref:Uncharacterized protein n=1 Tax=Fusarium solani TaxID=169388 RepID=A0A9P9G613_FUSSL|nr:uncharacterized protein B0J15DRAFT_472392 [Fusarium solani]KAH7231984.1 hypothetical protein B0J15DRAFT_472392 [Fusarium solani]